MSKTLRSRVDVVYQEAARLAAKTPVSAPHDVRILMAPDPFFLWSNDAAFRIAFASESGLVDCMASACHLPFEPGSVSHLILAFIPLDRVHTRLFIEEAKIVLKPGGRLSFLNFNPYRYAGRKLAHYMRSPEGHHPRLLSFFEIKDLLYEADLNIVDQQFFCFSQCMPQFDRWLQKFFPLWGYAYCVEAVKMPPMSTPTASFELAFPQPHNTPA